MSGEVTSLLKKYPFVQLNDRINALREVIQIIALKGLAKSGFFDHALFYGGTALRIFYNLDRFSEDLDFSLMRPNDTFRLAPYIDVILQELRNHDLNFVVNYKEKKKKTNIIQANVEGSLQENMRAAGLIEPSYRAFDANRKLKIRVEIDAVPPGHFKTEFKAIPDFSKIKVRLATLEYLFADKVHAFLCRSWGQRVKGRDWYDLIWYIEHGVSPDLNHLQARMEQTGDRIQTPFSTEDLIDKIKKKIKSTDIEKVKNDVRPFIKDDKILDKWNESFFIKKIESIKAE